MIRALLAVVLLGNIARADGGTLRISQAAGPFVISVFTAPELLRVGPADVSTLVQARSDGAILLDAAIELRLVAPDGAEQRLAATHASATNRLLQAATVDLHAPGRWQLAVTARRREIEATITCVFTVAAPTPRLSAQWPALAFPALCVLLFIWRERLRRARPRRAGQESRPTSALSSPREATTFFFNQEPP